MHRPLKLAHVAVLLAVFLVRCEALGAGQEAQPASTLVAVPNAAATSGSLLNLVGGTTYELRPKGGKDSIRVPITLASGVKPEDIKVRVLYAAHGTRFDADLFRAVHGKFHPATKEQALGWSAGSAPIASSSAPASRRRSHGTGARSCDSCRC